MTATCPYAKLYVLFLKKKVLFVFMFPFRIMVLTRKNNFHTTHTIIYYRRMYVKFLRHKVIMT